MGFAASKDTVGRLEELGCSYRFMASSSHPDAAEQGTVVCEIVELVTKRVWASARGHDKPGALQAAIKATSDAEKPKTPAETSAENLDLKRELAELKAKLEAEEPAESESDPEENDIEAIKLLLDDNGIEYDGRWGFERLLQLAVDNNLAEPAEST